MSSTKRGGQRSPADNYPTPAWCPARFLEVFVPRYPSVNHGLWLEPGAGEGNMIYGIQEYFRSARQQLPTFDAAELREECRPHLEALGVRQIGIGDFFVNGPPDPEAQYEVIITNPPFSLAREFILRGLASNTRFVVMLLRLNYVGSARRHPFFRKYAPDLYVLPDRPSFKGTGETDSIEYAWFVWDKDNLERSSGSYELLNLTPKDERKREHLRLTETGLFPSTQQILVEGSEDAA